MSSKYSYSYDHLNRLLEGKYEKKTYTFLGQYQGRGVRLQENWEFKGFLD